MTHCYSFKCKILGEKICCFECNRKCSDRCKNSPDKCNLAFEYKRGKRGKLIL